MWYYTLMIVASLEGRPITVVEHNMTLQDCAKAVLYVSEKAPGKGELVIDSLSCEKEATKWKTGL